jgi:hypothetical protein
MADWGIITGVLAATTIAFAIVSWRLYVEAVAARRERYIRGYVFSGALFEKLREKYKHLELKDCHLVARALREFFLAHLKSGRRYVGMPSRVVDDLWHEFILDTQEYSRFCQAAFGRYFHHTPATSMGKTKDEDAGLRLTWRYACMEENIDWRRPTRMPLMFAIDDKLKIANGFHYTLQREERRSQSEGSSSCGGGGACGGGGSSKSCGFACSGAGLVGGAAAAASCSGGSGGSGCGGGCGGGGCGGS